MRWPALMLAAASLAALGGCKKSSAAPRAAVDGPVHVETVTAVSHRFAPLADLSGEIRPASLANLTTQADGVIVQLNVDEGDHVKLHQLLAVIDDSSVRANLDRALASVGVARAAEKQAEVQLSAARTELVRSEKLHAAQAIDDQTVEAARAKVATLEAQAATSAAQIKQTQADVMVSETALTQHRVVSPIDGVVVKRYPRIHEFIGKDKPILDIIDTSAMELVTNVPADVAAALTPGGTLGFEVPSLGHKSFDGKIVAVVPQVDPQSRTQRVRARIDNPGGELLDGMFARAQVPAGAPHEAAAIPEPALRGEAPDRYVWIVRAGKAERAPVMPGAHDGGLVELTQGVATGDVIVLGGADGLKPGSQVIAVATPTPAPGAPPAPAPGAPPAPTPAPTAKAGD